MPCRYSDERGTLKKVYALKEVIITAGCLQSAKILFVSFNLLKWNKNKQN
jgi:hypothetical protein